MLFTLSLSVFDSIPVLNSLVIGVQCSKASLYLAKSPLPIRPIYFQFRLFRIYSEAHTIFDMRSNPVNCSISNSANQYETVGRTKGGGGKGTEEVAVPRGRWMA